MDSEGFVSLFEDLTSKQQNGKGPFMTNRKNEGNGDALHPVDLLLEEIWLKVISYIEPDSRDVINLSETCTWFKQLLDEKISACRLDEVIPLVLKFLPLTDVLRTRGVCKRANKTVDKILDAAEKISIGLIDENLFPRLVPLTYLKSRESFQKIHFLPLYNGTGIWLKSLKEIEEFREFLEESSVRFPSRNSIVRNKITVALPEEEENENANNALPPNENRLDLKQFGDLFIDKMLEMFKIASGNIHYLMMTDPDIIISSDLDKYHLMVRIAQALPKVCNLRIPTFLQIQAERNIDVLKEYIEDGHHLPECPSLEKLSFEFYTMPECYFREIASRYCLHIKILELCLHDDPSYYTDNCELQAAVNGAQHGCFEFPVLKTLHLFSIHWQCHPVLLRISAPRLEFLELHVKDHNDQSQAANSITELAKTITNFEALTKLSLRLPENFTSAETDTTAVIAALKMHNKRNLNVSNLKLKLPGTNSIPLRFFTRLCPSLESIQISIFNTEGHQPPLDRNSDWAKLYEHRMHDSLVWKDARKLKQIQCSEWAPRCLGIVQYTFLRPVPERHIGLVDQILRKS